MKVLLLILLITYSLNYNAANAVAYARQWWNSFNPAYYNYDNQGGDCANFVSQCLIAGGQSLSGCATDGKGCVPGVSNLKTCLTSKGWKSSSSIPRGFIAGYPVIFPGHATIATSVSGNNVLVACHSNPHYDSPTSWYGTPTYYYL